MIEKIKRSYTFKLLTIMLTIAVVVALIGMFTLQNTSAQVQTDQQTRIEVQTEIVADRIGGWVAEQREATRALSNHGTMNGGSEEAKRRLLRDEIERLPDSAADIHVVERRSEITSQGNNDTILLSTTTELEGQNLSVTNSNWPPSIGLNFDSVDETLVSWTYSDEGRPTVAVASPTLSGDRIVVVEYRTDQQAEAFNEVIGNADTKVVGTGTGAVLVDENTTNVLTQYRGNASATTVGSRILASEAGSDIGGSVVTDNNVAGYADVGQGIGWIVVREIPKSNVFGIVSDIQRAIGGLVLITTLGFLGVIGLVRRGPIRSIQRLEKQGNLLSEGDLSVEPAESDRVDEIGRLQTAFVDIHNYMETVAKQADALATQSFDDPVLDETVPGRLGESLNRMQADLEQFIEDIEQAREESERSREEAERLASSLERQAEEFSEVMTKAADGDLTQRLDADIDNAAMRDIAEQCNQMLTELERAMVRIEDLADRVDAASETAAESTKGIKSASEQVARSAQEIADGAEEQNENIEQVSDEMTGLSAMIEEVASSANEVAEISKQAAEAGEDGREYAAAAAEEMAAIDEKAAETIDEVETLHTEMERIGEVVELIDEIADQTNMLALNASIEAAHAGDSGSGSSAGEGFGVVADEIKVLAEETQEATNEIEAMIMEIQDSTERAVGDIREMGERVGSGQQTVTRATEALEEIVEQVNAANDRIQPVNDATDDQAASTEEVVAMTDEVSSISEDTAAQAESAAAAAEEQTASVSEVTQNIGSLSESASELRELVDEFDTSTDTTTVSNDETTTSSAE